MKRGILMKNTVKSIFKTVAVVLLAVVGLLAGGIYRYTNSFGTPSHLMFFVFIFCAMGVSYLLYSFCKTITGKIGKFLRVFFVLLFCLIGFCESLYFLFAYFAPLRAMLAGL